MGPVNVCRFFFPLIIYLFVTFLKRDSLSWADGLKVLRNADNMTTVLYVDLFLLYLCVIWNTQWHSYSIVCSVVQAQRADSEPQGKQTKSLLLSSHHFPPIHEYNNDIHVCTLHAHYDVWHDGGLAFNMTFHYPCMTHSIHGGITYLKHYRENPLTK